MPNHIKNSLKNIYFQQIKNKINTKTKHCIFIQMVHIQKVLNIIMDWNIKLILYIFLKLMYHNKNLLELRDKNILQRMPRHKHCIIVLLN